MLFVFVFIIIVYLVKELLMDGSRANDVEGVIFRRLGDICAGASAQALLQLPQPWVDGFVLQSQRHVAHRLELIPQTVDEIKKN